MLIIESARWRRGSGYSQDIDSYLAVTPARP